MSEYEVEVDEAYDPMIEKVCERTGNDPEMLLESIVEQQLPDIYQQTKQAVDQALQEEG